MSKTDTSKDSDQFKCECCGLEFATYDDLTTHQGYDCSKEYKQKGVLSEMYRDKGLSQLKIAEELGVTEKQVRYWMQKHDIPLRTQSEAKTLDARSTPLPFQHDTQNYEVWRGQIDNEDIGYTVHRLLAISEYGVEEVKGKEVHHLNGIKWDNRPENIEVLSVKEHRSHHTKQRWDSGEMEECQ